MPTIILTQDVINAIRRLVRSARAVPVEGVTKDMLQSIRAVLPTKGPASTPYVRPPQTDETMTCDLDIEGSGISTYTAGHPHDAVPHGPLGKLWLWTVDQDGRGIRTGDGGDGTIQYPTDSAQAISHQATVKWSTRPTKTIYGPGEWSLVGRP
jgi:hypothetical protein